MSLWPPATIAIVNITIASKKIGIDGYALVTLMREFKELNKPSAFLVYLYLFVMARETGRSSVPASHQSIADETGLSKSSVQSAVRLLNKHRFIRSKKKTQTSTPDHELLRSRV